MPKSFHDLVPCKFLRRDIGGQVKEVASVCYSDSSSAAEADNSTDYD